MRDKAILYPFDIESSPIIRYKEHLQLELIGSVAPRGWGLGRDINSVDGGQKTDELIETDFEAFSQNYNTVIINKPSRVCNFDKYIIPVITDLAKKQKKIIFNWDENRESTKELCKRLDINFTELSYDSKLIAKSSKLMDIKVPIIFVVGFSEMANKFYTQLALREHFVKKGYSVSQIGTKSYCELFGFKSFPQFMFQNLSDVDKVLMFNSYVKQIEREEKPDIIIIGVPGGLLPYNEMFFNYFGSIANIMSNAVKPDATVVNMLFGDYDSKIFDFKRNILRYKYGWDVDCYNMSNFYIDLALSEFHRDLQYSKVENDMLNRKIDALNEHRNESRIYNVLDAQKKSEMCNLIENTLSSYGKSCSV